MIEVKSFPIFYPPDGMYYIFSRDFGHFWRQRGSELDGGIVDCEPLSVPKEGLDMDNRIWKITTTTPASGKHGPRVTFQCAQTLKGSEDAESSGYLSKKGGKIMQSSRKMSWTLIGHGSKPFAYKIVSSDLRISVNAPMHSLLFPKTELRAEFHVTSAYDMRVYDPQWWYFVPVGQIDEFLTANGIRRSGK